MKPAATLAVYAAALAVVFGAAVGVGNAVGPVGTAAAGTARTDRGHGAAGDPGHAPAAAAATEELAPGGLAVSQDGYTLRPEATTFPAGEPAEFRFTVDGPDGRPLLDYTRSHDEDLHLVAVRRDLTGFSHVHPERAPDGTWSVPLTFAAPGPYKVFADFTPVGRDRALTLATDLTVPGDHRPVPLGPDRAATSVDGYDVALDGALVAGTSSPLTFTVARAGRPVTDLQPYLGAYGHLVALREGDLAYLHVHPAGALDEPGARPGPDITFDADVPTAARYRLFLDFSHGGVVRTAALTATATAGEADAPHDEDPHGH